ncbi:MAG TPA: dethiobiotin synthase [Terriglobia bacterium]|nr:dethiobiotin synthase [Terriglobia bacterium]
MKPDLFITGTDTNVGKTVLSALLTAALNAVYWKPVQSGALEGTDRQAVMQWAEISESQTQPESYCFDPPVSPHLAAREAGVKINLSEIHLPLCEGAPLIVEGAGGVLAPLNEKETIIDLIQHLGLPTVVASRTALGTINHTLLTLAALRQVGAEVRGVVMLGPENVENSRAIEHYGSTRVIGHIPWLREINRAALLDVFKAHFNRDNFK